MYILTPMYIIENITATIESNKCTSANVMDSITAANGKYMLSIGCCIIINTANYY